MENQNSNSEEALIERVKAFLEIEVNANRAELTSATRLFHDLGVTGDEASDLLVHFQKEFNVDIKDFSFDDHFTWEVPLLWPIVPFYWPLLLNSSFRKQVFRSRKRTDSMLIPLTVADLANAAKTGRLLSHSRN
ncbi:MAG: DUF1493 family protein [Candidatus Obscuribacterales bacterium]|nr:DUF1493 family protein [Candidatus Obscuribacterales bacterium]